METECCTYAGSSRVSELDVRLTTFRIQQLLHIISTFSEAIAVYQNDNPDRKVICANPMGQKFSVRLFDNTAATGIRSLNATIGTNITFTLRVELLEEDILQ